MAPIVRSSPLYDGLRHFLFLVPPLCAIAALGLIRLAAMGRRLGPRLARGMRLSIAAVLSWFSFDQVHTMIEIHPHQYVWFNRFVGGIAGAVDRYDTDYYGESYKAMLRDLSETLWNEEPKRYLSTVYRLRGCLGKSLMHYYLPPNFRASGRACRASSTRGRGSGATSRNCS